MRTIPSRTYLGALACALLIGAPTYACNKRKTGAADTATVRQLSATSWLVNVPGYTTTAVPLGVSYCAVGFKVPATSPITSVDAVVPFQQSNSASMPRFAFAMSTSVAAGFNAVSAGSWTGFLTQVTGPNTGGKDNFLQIAISVTNGTTQAQLETALKASSIAIDQATVSGSLLDKDRNVMTPKTVTAAAKLNRNAKVLHNDQHSTQPTRLTTTAEDTLYFMQPKDFRFGQGLGTGWRGVFEDTNRATAEVVQLGYIGATSGGAPDLTSLSTNVSFTLFGSGTGKASLIYTLTTAAPAPMPRVGGTRLVLPKPQSSTDVLRIHSQDGASLKIAAALRDQWTYSGETTAAAFGAKGTTLRLGALHDCGIVRAYNKSTAYSTTAETLEGPESMFPSIGRKDEIGFRVQAEQLNGAFGLIFVSPDYLATPLQSPFKDILVQTLTLAGTPFALSASGTADTGAVPLPSNISFAFQAIFFKFSGPNVEAAFSDAMLVRGQS